MGWRTIIINTHSKLTYRNNHLIYKDTMHSEQIHLSEIDVLLIETTDVTITTMLIKRLVDEKVLVLFCDDKRLPIAKIGSFYARHDSVLQLNRQIEWQEDRKASTWTAIIRQKIANQAGLLSQNKFPDKSNSLLKLHSELKPLDPNNREGHAARLYFNTLFGNQFNRNQDNDINAGLDYGYTLLMSMFAREIVVMGCMTQLGLKHKNQFNEFNLASDLMEPFRPIIDKIVYNAKDKQFSEIKRMLFTIFESQYQYDNKAMFLTNIVSDYTKKTIKVLNGDTDEVPVFTL